MKKLIKNLFLPFAVFAMLGLGALTLSASNVTNDVVTNSEATTENLSQVPYTGIVYYMDPVSGEPVATTENGEHCSLDVGSTLCFIEIDGKDTQAYGEDSFGVILPLFEID